MHIHLTVYAARQRVFTQPSPRNTCPFQTYLVVRPVALHEGRQAELLPHGEIVQGANAGPSIHGEGDDDLACGVLNRRLHIVASRLQWRHHLVVDAHSDTAEVEPGLRVVDARGCCNGLQNSSHARVGTDAHTCK